MSQPTQGLEDENPLLGHQVGSLVGFVGPGGWFVVVVVVVVVALFLIRLARFATNTTMVNIFAKLWEYLQYLFIHKRSLFRWSIDDLRIGLFIRIPSGRGEACLVD